MTQENRRTIGLPRRLPAVFLTLALVVLLALNTCAPAWAASTEKLDSLKEQAASLSGQESSLQSQLDDLQNQADSKLEEKALLEQQISVLSGQILTTQELIDAYDEQIADKQEELAQAQEQAEEYYTLFCTRFRDLEEQGTVSYWSILFSAKSFSDLLDRISFVSSVVRYDNTIVQQLELARDAVAQAKADLEQEQAEQEAAKAELVRQQDALAADEEAVEAAIAEIDAQTAVYESQLADIEVQASALDDEIAAAQKEYDDAVAAEKAAAEKAAAEKAAAEKAAAGNSGTTTYSSGRISMIWPCSSTRITSYFGKRTSPTAGASTYHQGLDIGASSGSAIYAAASGTVTSAGYNSARGNYVVISHGSGVSTVYMHCSAVYVSAGDSVSQGQTIAAVGSTGISTGPHLHFGVIEDGSYVNPLNYVS